MCSCSAVVKMCLLPFWRVCCVPLLPLTRCVCGGIEVSVLHVVLGNMGGGKGLITMSIIEQAVRSGRPVMTNIDLLDACPYQSRVARIGTDRWPIYRGVPERKDRNGGALGPSPDYMAWWLYAPDNSVVVIDEADVHFDCSEHSAMGADCREAHKWIRKSALDVFYVAQKLPNLYVRIRRLTDIFIVCEHTWRSRSWPKFLAFLFGEQFAMGRTKFIRSEFSAEEFSEQTHLRSAALTYPEASRYFNWYPTKQVEGKTLWMKLRAFHYYYGLEFVTRYVEGLRRQGVVIEVPPAPSGGGLWV